MFWQYLTCEISYQGKPVFHIDGNWYQVMGDFEISINYPTKIYMVKRKLFLVYYFHKLAHTMTNKKKTMTRMQL